MMSEYLPVIYAGPKVINALKQVIWQDSGDTLLPNTAYTNPLWITTYDNWTLDPVAAKEKILGGLVPLLSRSDHPGHASLPIKAKYVSCYRPA